MNLKEISDLAISLMRKYGLSDWTFKWGDDKSMERRVGGYAFGKTLYQYKKILLSRSLTKNDASMDRIMNTILHEIAHALDFKQRGKSAHDDVWKEIATSIGCNANELTELDTVDMSNVAKWIAQCDKCDKKFFTQYRPKTRRSCSDCDEMFNPDFELEFNLNPRVVKTYESFINKMRKKLKFIKPKFNLEWEEAMRYPEFLEIGKKGWILKAMEGDIELYRDIENVLGNVDINFDSLEVSKKERFNQSFERGVIETPIAVKFGDDYDLVAGNTRVAGLINNGVTNFPIWVIQVS